MQAAAEWDRHTVTHACGVTVGSPSEPLELADTLEAITP